MLIAKNKIIFYFSWHYWIIILFLPHRVVVECLKSTDNSMVVSSLRILKTVIDKREAQSIRKATVKAVLGIMEKLTNTDLDMIAETFKLIKTIIECNPHDLSSS